MIPRLGVLVPSNSLRLTFDSLPGLAAPTRHIESCAGELRRLAEHHMRTLPIAIALFLAFAMTHSSALAQAKVMELGAEEQQVLAIEDEYVVAEVNRDEAALRRILDDRFLWNRSNGSITGKEDYVQSIMSDSFSLVEQTIRERSVLLQGEVAFVFGTADLRFAPAGQTETTSSLRYTAAYVRRDGQWRMLVLQMQGRSPE
jgi:ketosteroid isomerase-like protein